MADVLLAVMIFLPLALVFLFKSNAAYLFLSVCAGFVLVSYSADALKNLLDSLGLTGLDSNNLGLILLLAPAVITILFTRKAFRARSKLVVHIIPAVCTGGLLALTAVPLLIDPLSVNLSDSKFWAELQEIEAGVVGVGATFSLLILWFGSLKRIGRKH